MFSGSKWQIGSLKVFTAIVLVRVKLKRVCYNTNCRGYLFTFAQIQFLCWAQHIFICLFLPPFIILHLVLFAETDQYLKCTWENKIIRLFFQVRLFSVHCTPPQCWKLYIFHVKYARDYSVSNAIDNTNIFSTKIFHYSMAEAIPPLIYPSCTEHRTAAPKSALLTNP